eukprot:TRINITY_DN60411_c0_g1_i1.p2 TRINITY_DN60411_c0_g1~~TRINITY_DN60411_c0_g1_i1.p2  ORF type:complete len:152 (-),score=27.52 TRINITY_DN60411_c0_g1_i1:463-918(-)
MAAQILVQAAARSRPLPLALQSGRPLVIDFSATWCIECLQLAPAMRDLEQRFGKEVEFVSIDVSNLPSAVDDSQSDWWVRQFKVDMLPHIAFVDKDGSVLTALVGNLPPEVLRANMEELSRGNDRLPYNMFDAFENGRRKLALPPSEAESR